MPRVGRPQRKIDDATGEQLADVTGKLAWRLRVRDPRTGRQREETFYGSEAQAVKRLEKFRAALAVGPTEAPRRASAVTFGEAFLDYLIDYAWRVKPGRDPDVNPGVRRPYATWSKVRDHITSYLLDEFSDRRLVSVAAEEYNEHILSLTARNRKALAPDTKATVASVLRGLLAWAHRTYGTPDIAEQIPKMWGARETRRTAYIPSVVEVRKLARAMDTEWRYPAWCRHVTGPHGEGFGGDLVRVLANVGPRWSELVALPPTKVKLAEHVAEVQATASEAGGQREHREGAGKTAHAVRRVAIPDDAVEALKRLNAMRRIGREREPAREARRAARKDRGRRAVNRPVEQRWTTVVCGERGGWLAYSSWRKHLAKARAACGVDLSAHGMRHFAASVMFAAGASEGDIMEQMGHGSIQTTRRIYRHLFAVGKTEVAKRMSAGLETLLAAEVAAAEAAAAKEKPTREEQAEIGETEPDLLEADEWDDEAANW
jgi:integrase